jgi:hypothetical protein
MPKSTTIDPRDDPNRIVSRRRSYTNKRRADLVRYWKTPSVVDEKSPSGRLRCPTLGEVECHTGVPKSNVDRWAKEEEKFLRGRADARTNRLAAAKEPKPKRRPKDDPLWDVVARDHVFKGLGKR